MSKPTQIAIVGGGIAGLAAAFRLRELSSDCSIRIFEASGRLGGALQTHREDGLLIEQGADSFISNVPWGVDLCRRLGIESELLATDETRRQAFVVHRGKLVKVPQGFLLMSPSQLGPVLTTPLLSPLGKLRLLAEWFVPARRLTEDESLGAFVRRRFGRHVFERLVQPLVSGIYTADPERLSVQATMPRFQQMEREFGSLLRATLKREANDVAESGARYGMFLAPRSGMARIIERLTEKLPADAIQLNSAVDRIEIALDGKWQLTVVHRTPSEPLPLERLNFDAVIVAVPAFQAAKTLESLDTTLSTLLRQIPYASTSIVNMVYRRNDIGHPIDGFGFVVPAIENRQILAASFASNKFPGRAPDGQTLIRVFIGGACQAELAALPEGQLRAIAVAELADLLRIKAEPLRVGVARWPHAMPQYHVGHLDRIRGIETRTGIFPGLALAGSAYRGVGVPHSVRSGEDAAELVLSSTSRS